MPKIIFRYSSIYDQHFKEFMKLKYPQDKEEYPTKEEIINYINEIKEIWNKIEKSVLDEMTAVTNLNWSMKFITCYVVGDCIPFSEPLTLKIFKNKNIFIDILTHELIHELFIQKDNVEKMRNVFNQIENKFGKESQKTKIHIPLNAVHTHLYKKLFTEERLKNNINRHDKFVDYKKAWKIVNNEGYENILRYFK